MSAPFLHATPDGIFEIGTSGATEGERRKADALTLLELRRRSFIRRARRAFAAKLLTAGKVNADDVREAVALPEGIGAGLFGAVPLVFVRLRIAEFSGFATSCRPSRHAGLNRVWRLIDAPAAQKWLADSPELPDPSDDLQDGAQRLLFPLSTNEASPVGAGLAD